MIRVLGLVKEFPNILKLELEMRPMRHGDTEHGTYVSATITDTTSKKDKKKKKKKKDKKGASQEDLTYQKNGEFGGSFENLAEGQTGQLTSLCLCTFKKKELFYNWTHFCILYIETTLYNFI